MNEHYIVQSRIYSFIRQVFVLVVKTQPHATVRGFCWPNISTPFVSIALFLSVSWYKFIEQWWSSPSVVENKTLPMINRIGSLFWDFRTHTVNRKKIEFTDTEFHVIINGTMQAISLIALWVGDISNGMWSRMWTRCSTAQSWSGSR